jgi:SPIRAL1-like protein
MERGGVGPVFGRRLRESSNAFAHGANQNCGNVISDTPTTRINAPPGGASTLRLG